MHIFGKWLTDLQDPEDMQYFESMHKTSPYENIVRYQTFNVHHINQKNYKYIAIVEAGGGVNQLFMLEADDLVTTYCGCSDREKPVYFNTDGIAYMELHRHSVKLGFWALDNSPYDIEVDDSEHDIIVLLNEIGDMLGSDGFEQDQTYSNVLFVGQL